ncbi:hypothetical protein FB45DRAFT_987185 [Roridomyces roridus]|uniref:Uncharacterized protein n=1 Tax=Roridomyces roridus TaxID=1738132 RepID=A0AAD7CFF6_9AGAR|nr:hypothetical protein FB45DRAFT_987185 [Roridomyces roridus]
MSDFLSRLMRALKLRQGWDDYKQVSTDAADGELEEEISLMTGNTGNVPRRKRTSCGLVWKAFAIVAALFAIWNGFKLLSWALTPRRTGLENMPEYSTSLGCLSSPYVYSGEAASFSIPVTNAEHGIDMLRGGAVGTFTLLQGAATETQVRYQLSIQTDNKALLDDILLNRPSPESGKPITISTPSLPEGSCMRYDLKMFIPPNLKKLHIRSHTVTHLQVDPESEIQLDALFVTLFVSDPRNMVIPHTNLRAHEMVIELYDGWLVGDVGVDGLTKLTTQRGPAVMNVRAHPVDSTSSEPAQLRTTTGAGRTDVFYIDSVHRHRAISNVHLSSKNAPMYLTYRNSQFNGLVELASQSFTATGVDKLAPAPVDGTWTHAVGDPQGRDRLAINSRGWTGLYF